MPTGRKTGQDPGAVNRVHRDARHRHRPGDEGSNGPGTGRPVTGDGGVEAIRLGYSRSPDGIELSSPSPAEITRPNM
ncbi:predicted protein [Chaetomium globosum CBS 148.51]|uniref:Uncharacterized protein n=1 Tax=Chaetomium globosum (strain ATCC 6205 / CBS 148.51 / DSM 1962 / NBRC 6347 / NRRL 1970) TaxID=306901 RepID=Q2HBQ4_CHAGB|nr:uncharacterized protein CHGG_02350 [Chaetomium globosum CBS 148.51]EAQ90415.1 predicted protein [Chaetomium globosum CBS 148.51]